MFFEVLGYIFVLLCAGIGSYKLALSVEEAEIANDVKYPFLMISFVSCLFIVFFVGFAVGGRDLRVAKYKEKIVEEAKVSWDNSVKDKLFNYNSLLDRKKQDFSIVTNELARIKMELVRLEKINKSMSSNMVPRYVVAPIMGEVGVFEYSSIFPRYYFDPLVEFLEPEVEKVESVTK